MSALPAGWITNTTLTRFFCLVAILESSAIQFIQLLTVILGGHRYCNVKAISDFCHWGFPSKQISQICLISQYGLFEFLTLRPSLQNKVSTYMSFCHNSRLIRWIQQNKILKKCLIPDNSNHYTRIFSVPIHAWVILSNFSNSSYYVKIPPFL